MDEPAPGDRQSASLPKDRLDSWKEIAAYLNRDVTTVQRWEKREGMPVHRHQHDRIGSVYASRAEVDAWVTSRNLRTEQQNGNGVSTSNPAASGPAAHVVDGAVEPTVQGPRSVALESVIGAEKSRRWQALLGAALVLAAVGGWYLWTRARNSPQPAKQKLMVAVLPFQNLTGDAGQDYFSDGLTEEMVTQVGNLDPQHLGVIARTSAMYYKNHPQPLQQVGRDLGVQYVLEGSVRREAEKARISVRLVRVADGTTIWTDSFDRHVAAVLSLQSEIAQRVGSALEVQVLGPIHPKPVKPPTNPEVVEAYLRGRFELNSPLFQMRLEPISSALSRWIPRMPRHTPAWRIFIVLAQC